MTGIALGDVCEVTTGQSAPQDPDAFGSCGIPFIRAGSLERLCAGESENSLELVAPDKAKQYRLKVYPENTVVFPKSGMSAKVGRVYRLKRDCHLVSHLAAVLPSKRVDSSYLHRWFEYSPPSRLIENDAYPSIKTSTLEKIQIPFPPLTEQRRIAAILDKADALRAKRREAIAKLDQLLQSVFLDMFGDPVANPRGLKIAPLQAICREIYRYPTYYGIEYESHGVPEVRGEMITPDGRVDSEQARYISLATSQRFPRTQLSSGDLVMSVRGTIGKIGLVPDRLSGANMTANLIRISPKSEKVHPIFLWRFAMSEYFAQYVNQASSSTTIKTIKAPDLRAMPVMLPRMSEQLKFVDAYRAHRSLCDSAHQSNRHLDNLFASLQSKAFAGPL